MTISRESDGNAGGTLSSFPVGHRILGGELRHVPVFQPRKDGWTEVNWSPERLERFRPSLLPVLQPHRSRGFVRIAKRVLAVRGSTQPLTR